METETVSKKVGQGDLELKSDSTNATIDLLPPEMLQSIYKFLPFQDLLRCREVSKKWKSVATVPVRKRCALLEFTRRDIPKSQRCRALQSFIELIRATSERGDLEEFPVTKFILLLGSAFYWTEIDGSTLISQFLEAVGPFVKHIIFRFNEGEKLIQVPNDCLAISQDLTFPNLTKITLEVFEDRNKHIAIFSFIRKIIEKCPKIEEIQPHLYNVRRSGAIRRCIVETGIEQKTSLVTSLYITAPKTETDFKYLNKLSLKLNDFELNFAQHNGNTETFKEFLETQSDTLTSLSLDLVNGNDYQFLRELPCLPHLKNLVVWCSDKKREERCPSLFYKAQLPVLKNLDLKDVQFATNYLMASHIAPSESLRELILPQRGIEDAGEVIRQAARLFPNLKKMQVSHATVGPYMSDIYETLTGIEELCITTRGRVNVDDIITGLPERLLHKIRHDLRHFQTPSYNMSKALAMLERGTTKTLACLENLKILMIYRGQFDSVDVVDGEDFTELSGVVFKQMKGLERIDFGVRKYGPIVNPALKEDLENQGIKLVYQRPPYVRSRTDFIQSLTESAHSDSDNSYSGREEMDSDSDFG